MHWWFLTHANSQLFIVASTLWKWKWKRKQNQKRRYLWTNHCHINIFYQFIAHDPPKIIDSILRNVHITMQWSYRYCHKNWWIYEIDQPHTHTHTHKKNLITFIRDTNPLSLISLWIKPLKINATKMHRAVATAGCTEVKT